MPNTKAVGVAFSDPELDGAVIGTSGGTVGFYGTTPVAKGAALTTQLTTISSTAPVTPDYAIQDLVNSSAFGFVTKDEGNTVLSVIKNLQDRVGQLETRLQAYGLLP
jgi:hypothetical protein